MKRSSRILVILGIIVLTVIVLLWGTRRYLASHHGAKLVADRLQTMFGGQVRLTEVDVGLRGTSLRRLQVFEHGSATSGAEPWVEVAQVETDVSALDLLGGTVTPKQLTLSGAAVTLRFDEGGQLLTRLPKGAGGRAELPRVRLRDSRLTLQQDKRPPLSVDGIQGELSAEGDKLVFRGTVADAQLGEWTLAGTWDMQAGAGQATLRTARPLHVTQAQLEGLPFVPAAVWEQVKVDGTTSAEILLRTETGDPTVRYRVELEPTATRVFIPSIDLRAEQAQGRVLVEDAVVHLCDVRGRVADGELEVSAELNFRDTPERLNFLVSARGLEVRQLPESWQLPPQIEGPLHGWADLHLTLLNDAVRTSGSGQGDVVNGRFAGLPARTLRLRLRSDGKGFRFGSSQPGAALPGALPLLAIALQPPPVVERPPDWLSWPVRGGNFFMAGVRRAMRILVEGGAGLVARLTQDRPPDPKAQPSYLEANLGLDDVDLERLISGLGLKLPFTVSGRITFEVQAAIPLDTPRDLKTYRFTGTATLPHFTLDGLRLEQVRARVTYRDGILRLEELSGRVPAESGTLATKQENPSVGTFQGTARLEVIPQGDLTAKLTLDRIPLARVLTLIPGAAETADGAISATVTARVPAARLQEIEAWDITGESRADRLRAFGLSLEQPRMDLRLQRGVLTATTLRAVWYEGEITGSAALTLKPLVAGKLDLRFQKLDVGVLTRHLPAMPFSIEGKADGTVQATLAAMQAGRDPELTAKIELESPRLRVRGVPTEQLHGTLSYRDRGIHYAFEGEALGGRFRLNGKVPLTPPKPAAPPADPKEEGHFRLEKAQLARLWEALDVQTALGSLQGVVDLDIRFRHEGSDRVPVGSGRFAVENLRWGRTSLAGGLRGEVLLREREIRLRDLTGTVGQGLVRGQVGLSLRPEGRSWFTLDLSQVEASQLLAPWPLLAGGVQGLLQVRLRGSVGREWSGSGEVTLSRGKVLGAEVAEWRVPLSWSVAPARGRGQIDVRDSSAQVAQGRATGRASFRWGAGNRLEGQLNFHNVQLRPLLRQVADLTTLGDSQLSGRIDFSGTDLRSVDDVTATLTATLGRTQVFEFPVFRQLTPYLTPGQSSAGAFQSGELRATLARGVVNLQHLSLQGSVLQLFAEGTVTLQGRLELDVLANTGRIGPNPSLLRLLGLRLPAIGPIPLTLILEVSDYLSNRLLRLRVSGTIRSPVVRVDAVALLTDAAVRFFVRQASVPLR